MKDNTFLQSWAEDFPEESQLLEDLLTSGDFGYTTDSKIRIALDQKIISWSSYKTWIQNKIQCASLTDQLSHQQITQLKSHFEVVQKNTKYTHLCINDCFVVCEWENITYFFGLYPTFDISQNSDFVFVLCSAENLKIIHTEESISSDISNTKAQPNQDIWSTIKTHHDQNTMAARKQFDAYLVLKIIENKTVIFKMDEDLEKEDLNLNLFKYSLDDANPFSDVYKNGLTTSFNINQLKLSILDFKYACITPLKLGMTTVGFFVGFKTTQLSEDDETTLQEISNRYAS